MIQQRLTGVVFVVFCWMMLGELRGQVPQNLPSVLPQPSPQSTSSNSFPVQQGTGIPQKNTAVDPRLEQVPEVLRPWIPWALWDDGVWQSPPTYRSANERIGHWVSKVQIDADENAGRWTMPVRVFHDAWIPLPGGVEYWPIDVVVDGRPAVVLEHAGYPSVKLPAGSYELSGKWRWKSMPQKLRIPRSIGWIELRLRGEDVPAPTWDAQSDLWFNRATLDAEQKDQYSFQVYRLIEDGAPIWLRTTIEVTATGKSREEDFGFVIPQGWQLSYVTSSIPVAVDEMGRLKAQLRAGNWTILLDAFRTEDVKELSYAPDSPPAKRSELIALRSAPNLRSIELQGVTPVDVQMTQFPQAWRDLSVFEWKTANPATLVEKSRGVGLESPNQLHISRVFWLDDDGSGVTYSDQLRGEPKQITRLDVSPNHELGVARVDGIRQLITENPVTGSPGFELRTRRPEIEAIGRMDVVNAIPATGWQVGAKELEALFYLPPGWRMLALFGPDRVEGDWVTAWTLLDLFLLLVLSLAVLRLYGWLPALIALGAFALSYHEPGSPRWTWFLLLVPVALLRVVGSNRGKQGLVVWRNIALAILLLNLLPFMAAQIQNAIYPQLEPSSIPFRTRTLFQWMDQTSNSRTDLIEFYGQGYERSLEPERLAGRSSSAIIRRADEVMNVETERVSTDVGKGQAVPQVANMQYDPKTNIQTGVAKPQWVGNVIRCYWDGPVAQEEVIRPVLLSCNQHRLLTVIRLGLLLGLLYLLLTGGGFSDAVGGVPGLRRMFGFLGGSNEKIGKDAIGAVLKGIGWIVIGVGVFCASERSLYGQAPQAPSPDAATLELLKKRMEVGSDAFPHAADLTQMRLKLEAQGNANAELEASNMDRLSWQGVVHAVKEVAVPLPGKLPSWFPQKVLLDGTDALVTQREDGYLWMLVPEGIHRIEVIGRVMESAEWTLSFLLTPRVMEIDANEWSWTGVNAEGKPESQVIFVRKKQVGDGQVSYDQRNYRAVFLLERRLEIGLVWKVQTTVRRMSRTGKAGSLSIPLLAGEQVVAGGLTTRDGVVELNFGAEDQQVSWNSEMPVSDSLKLQAVQVQGGGVGNAGNIVERWRVESSPVWSMRWSGLEPIFDQQSLNLVPVWYPWPGESVELRWTRPVAVSGKLLTIQGLVHEMDLGYRQRQSTLWFEIESSLGGDQRVQLPPGSTVTAIEVGGRSIPIRRQDDACLITLQPGAQRVQILWNNDEPLTGGVALSQVVMPDEVANVRSVMRVPASRWILWANGPVRGPAVRFWVILAVAVVVALVLGSRVDSPLRRWEWVLLAIGLTQVSAFASVLFVVWLFSIPARERMNIQGFSGWKLKLLQVGHITLTVLALSVLISVVAAGLLGTPRMFIVGNESSDYSLQWFTPMSGGDLPRPWIFSISIWFYRLMMLLWALWLANSLLRWLLQWWKSMVQTEPTSVAAEGSNMELAQVHATRESEEPGI